MMAGLVSDAPRGCANGVPVTQLWGMLGVSVAICAVLMWDTRLSIDPWLLSNAGYGFVIAVLLAIRFACAGSANRWAAAGGDYAEYFALFMATALIGAVSSYPIAALSHGFIDAHLEQVDAALHFNWLAWYEMVARHRTLQILGVMGYQSIYLIPALLLAAFAMRGQRREAHRFIVGFWVAAVITLIFFRFLPAEGPMSYLWKGPIYYMPTSEVVQANLIPVLRLHQGGEIDLNQLQGLVSAPSFHAASGVLYIAAAWRCGPLRWPLIALSLAMLLSTPVEGTHYLSDMILGALVALVAVAAASKLMDRFARAPA
jgi:membrane-associated phospholipid phosphatase